MASSRDGSLSSAQVHELLSKLGNQDKDFRYMALNDLLTELQKSSVPYEDSVASKVTEALLRSLEDIHGEVQNMAIKCLGPWIRRCRSTQTKLVVDRLCKTNANEELKDISATALRTVIMGVAADSPVATSVTKQLMPQLLTQLKAGADSSDALLDRLDVLIELLDKFEAAVAALPLDEKVALLQVLTDLLNNARPAVRKRSVVALGTLSLSLPDAQFAHFMSQLIQMLSITKVNDKLKTLISLQGQICKQETLKGSCRFGDYLQTMIPPVLDSLQLEDDELREISLQSLEAFVLQGNAQIKRYEAQIIEAALQYLEYDPNYDDTAEDDENDEEMVEADDESDLGSDFEDDAEYDDDDDISWKLRRCAAKLANAIIVADVKLGINAIARLAPRLVARIHEREENVRIEILATLTTLLEQCRFASQKTFTSRKRHRDEEEMEVETSPLPQKTVLDLSSKILKSIIKQLTGKNMAIKQYCFAVLEGLLKIDSACLILALPQILPSARNAALGISSGNLASTSSALKITTLQFIDVLSTTSPVTALAEYVGDIVDLVADTIHQEKMNKVLLEAIKTAQDLLGIAKSIQSPQVFSRMAVTLFDKLATTDLDQEVRDELIISMSSCVWQEVDMITTRACDILAVKLDQESTRLVAIASIGKAATVCAALPRQWVVPVTREMAKFVNNVNRALRTAAISTSTILSAQAGPDFDDADVKHILQCLVTVISNEDKQMVVNGIAWLSVFSQNVRQTALVKEITLPIVLQLLSSPIVTQSSVSTRSLLAYFNAIAKTSDSSELLKTLYGSASSTANLSLLAKFVAAILINESSATFLNDCIKKIQAPKTSEEKRALEIYVLGEYGRLHALDANIFDLILAQFNSPADHVRGAASVALGNIASLDPALYAPRLFIELEKTKGDRYLLAVSIKEMIVNASEVPQSKNLAEQAEAITTELLRRDSGERAQTIVAESIGRLTQLRPLQLLPKLRAGVKSESANSRSLVIRAIRYTFTASNSNFDEQLRPFIVDFLSLVEDADVEIRRLALTTLHSAAHNKPHLIVDHLSTLLPLLYRETIIRKDLQHSVQMGPFKHIVDDGLEIRKNAFETLHTLLESFYTSMDITTVYEIILRGLDDVNEIKTLCFLMTAHLVTVAPSETRGRLDAITEKLQKHMAFKLKDTAVKQDREKDNEMKRYILRCIISLQPLASDATPGFNAFFADMRATRAQEMDEIKSSAFAVNGKSSHDRMEL